MEQQPKPRAEDVRAEERRRIVRRAEELSRDTNEDPDNAGAYLVLMLEALTFAVCNLADETAAMGKRLADSIDNHR